MHTILSRKEAFKLAWHIFWFATGTSRVRINIRLNGDIELQGAEFIES